MIDPITNQTLSAIQQGLFLLENHGITLIFTSSFLYLIIKAINAAIEITVKVIEKRYGVEDHHEGGENPRQKKIKQITYLFDFFKQQLAMGL